MRAARAQAERKAGKIGHVGVGRAGEAAADAFRDTGIVQEDGDADAEEAGCGRGMG
jgi:hypothetical protein